MLYGRIRGIDEGRLQGLVQHLIDKLGLGPFADNISQTYSGGNKRKLSLALALIGDPTVVFLYVHKHAQWRVQRRAARRRTKQC